MKKITAVQYKEQGNQITVIFGWILQLALFLINFIRHIQEHKHRGI